MFYESKYSQHVTTSSWATIASITLPVFIEKMYNLLSKPPVANVLPSIKVLQDKAKSQTVNERFCILSNVTILIQPSCPIVITLSGKLIIDEIFLFKIYFLCIVSLVISAFCLFATDSISHVKSFLKTET